LAYSELTFTPEVWDGVLHRLQSEVPAFTFETWLQPLQPRRLDEGLLLVCPSTFHRERIRRHFLPRIDACLREETGEDVEIALGIDPSPTKSIQSAPSGEESSRPEPDGSPKNYAARESPTSPREGVPAKQAAGADTRARLSTAIPPAPTSSTRMRSVPLPPGSRARAQAGETPGSAPLDRRASGTQYTFESFVVGPCNALAREASFAMAQGQQQALNQIYLRADAGMGKTHLARAVASEAVRLGNGAVKYLSSESFTNQFLSALRSNRTSDFKRRYRGRNQLFVMEDIQFLEGKAATQLEFFHTVQHILDAGGRILLTGDRMPQDMPQLSPRIRSQLDSGFLAELEPPDHRVRRAILRSKAASGGVGLPTQCLDALVENIRGSVRELEGVLIQLVTTASLLKRPIDLKLTESAIAKKTSAVPRRRRLGVGDVIGVVAGFFQSSPDQLASRSRRKQILLPRQLAMYLCRRYTDAPVGEIGQALGRDHPAVRNAIEKIERGILERPPLRYQVEALGERLDALLAELDPKGRPPHWSR
jgi:chromosomal replication initiator protein